SIIFFIFLILRVCHPDFYDHICSGFVFSDQDFQLIPGLQNRKCPFFVRVRMDCHRNREIHRFSLCFHPHPASAPCSGIFRRFGCRFCLRRAPCARFLYTSCFLLAHVSRIRHFFCVCVR